MMAIHTGDGTFDRAVAEGPSGCWVDLPILCPLRGPNRVVILGGMWDSAFQNAFAAENISRRVGGEVYIVGENKRRAWAARLGLPVCDVCGPGWREGGAPNCECGEIRRTA